MTSRKLALVAAACGLLALPLAAGVLPIARAAAASPAQALPAPKIDVALTAAGKTETAVLSGGCFWGVQGVFEHVKGVKKVYSGYSGGPGSMAQYERVSTGMTGHAESVEITFDPQQISYGEILRIFFTVATDPTQLNMQFPDEGTQYRNEIFYATPDQKRVAEAYIQQLNDAHVFRKPIVTRVDPLKGFFKAEDYHQDYLTRHPEQPYIATYDIPKVAMLRQVFPDRYIATPTTVFPLDGSKARPMKTAGVS
ncbi:peptide-methionine (S)-S-oxide reductase MsrA [Phenylobacterium sp.]|uniref:peptide-methionine (S)-S-oxide reductase MsrA n=1 Tax=Phenylobacterium sp. TaxID=1871053 RepID=UPI00122A80A6|nr:peptide-methionine (S)-S-oxide reductase MsrA [Phenylobacterium sp.]THD60425.1 MAG: peptide-methionine (S)-S-oxide reductase MsrA [Phenylobacterium sp.]